MNSGNKSVDVVIPAYNCDQTIDELLNRVSSGIRSMGREVTGKIILVDDGSSDSTWSKIVSYISNHQSIQIIGIQLSRNFGQHPATVAGLRQSTADLVVIMDCDLQDPPELILDMFYEIVNEESEICYAVGDSYRGNSGSFLSWLFFKLQKNSRSDGKKVGTYRIITARVRDFALQNKELSKISGPVIDSLGFKKSYVTYARQQSSVNGTRYTFNKRLDLGLAFVLSRNKFIAKIFIFMSIFLFLINLAYASVIFLNYFFKWSPLPAGINQVVVLLLGITSLVAFTSGIIIVFLQEILDYSRGGPDYITQNTVSNYEL